MNFALNQRSELSLASSGLLEIPDAAGVQVTCRRGCLWITLDNDTRDIVLEAGQTFSGTEHRRALVYALQPSTMALRPQTENAFERRGPRGGMLRNALST